MYEYYVTDAFVADDAICETRRSKYLVFSYLSVSVKCTRLPYRTDLKQTLSLKPQLKQLWILEFLDRSSREGHFIYKIVDIIYHSDTYYVYVENSEPGIDQNKERECMGFHQLTEWFTENLINIELWALLIIIIVLLVIIFKLKRDNRYSQKDIDGKDENKDIENFVENDSDDMNIARKTTENTIFNADFAEISIEQRDDLLEDSEDKKIYSETDDEKNLAKNETLESQSISTDKDQSEKNLLVLDLPIDETPNIDRVDFSKFEGKRILVAEDSLINQKLLATLLSHTGIELDFAGNGKVALDKIVKDKKYFDLVLMDVNMPEMDGLEATVKIRKDPELDDLPVVALTASTDKNEVEKILGSGMNGYLDKPIVLGKMYTAFKIFLKDYVRNDTTQKRISSSLLDTAHGIEHSMGDRSLYKSILEDFLKQYEGSADLFIKLVKGRHFTELKKMIIDLMGLSGTIGAMSIYEIMEKSNRALIYGNEEMLPELARDFNREFRKLTREIKEYLG